MGLRNQISWWQIQKSPLENQWCCLCWRASSFSWIFLISGQLFSIICSCLWTSNPCGSCGHARKLKNLDYEKGTYPSRSGRRTTAKSSWTKSGNLSPPRSPKCSHKTMMGPTVNLEKKQKAQIKTKWSLQKNWNWMTNCSPWKESLQEDALKTQCSKIPQPSRVLTLWQTIKGCRSSGSWRLFETVEMQIKKNCPAAVVGSQNLVGPSDDQNWSRRSFVEKKFSQSSGNSSFDENALSVVIKASPYPAPRRLVALSVVRESW